MTDELFLDLSFLQNNHSRIYFFGLGFIQVKINDKYRVHFYTKELPSTTMLEEIHNHRYDFKSDILKGTLTQELYGYTLNPDGEYRLTQETCNPSNKKEFDKYPCSIQKLQTQIFAAGSTYTTNHNTLHRVESSDAITLLERNEYKKNEADVIYHKDYELVCPFSVKVDDEQLWDIIKRRLND